MNFFKWYSIDFGRCVYTTAYLKGANNFSFESEGHFDVFGKTDKRLQIQAAPWKQCSLDEVLLDLMSTYRKIMFQLDESTQVSGNTFEDINRDIWWNLNVGLP